MGQNWHCAAKATYKSPWISSNKNPVWTTGNVFSALAHTARSIEVAYICLMMSHLVKGGHHHDVGPCLADPILITDLGSIVELED